MVRALIIVAILPAFVVPLEVRGDCRQFFVQQQQLAYVQPVYYPQIYYAAGRDIEAEALAHKVAKLVAAQLRAEDRLPSRQQAQSTLLSQACGKCHTGPNPKGGLTIDGETQMSCELILDSISSVASGKMPQGIKLTPEQKGQVLDELLALRKKSTPITPPTEGELK